MTNPLLQMGYSPEAVLAIYRDQVARLAEKVKAARIATDNGVGGEKGKRYEGKFLHQIEGQFIAAVDSVRELERGTTRESALVAMARAEQTIAEVFV